MEERTSIIDELKIDGLESDNEKSKSDSEESILSLNIDEET